MSDHYSHLMRELESAQGEEQQQAIMQQIVEILRDPHLLSSNVTQHIFVSSKFLSDSDMYRVLVSKKDVESRIFPYLNQQEDISSGIPVLVYGSDGKPCPMTLKFSNPSYFLCNGWQDFFHKQTFHKGDLISIWLFCERHPATTLLRLAIASRPALNIVINNQTSGTLAVCGFSSGLPDYNVTPNLH